MTLEQFLALAGEFLSFALTAGKIWFALVLLCVLAVPVFAVWAFRQQEKDAQRMKAESEARRAEMERKWRGR